MKLVSIIAVIAFNFLTVISTYSEQKTSYNPEAVLSFIDLKTNQTQLYLLGESHDKSELYVNALIELTNNVEIFAFFEGKPYIPAEIYNDDEHLQITHLGIEDFIYKHFLDFKDFLDTYLRYQHGYSSYEEVTGTLNHLKFTYIRYFALVPQEIQLKIRADTSPFYAFCRSPSINTPVDFDNPTFIKSAYSAALDLLELIQKSLHPLSQSDYQLLKQKYSSGITPQDTILTSPYGLLTYSITMEPRDSFFADNIKKLYDGFEIYNKPIVIRMGYQHLAGVSALLKEKGIAHTFINLETMQAIEVTPENQPDAVFKHDEL